MKNLLCEISSSVVKNVYKLITQFIFNGDTTKGNQIVTDKDGNPILTVHGQEQTYFQYYERYIANKFFRQGADRRFEPGVLRLLCTDAGWNPKDPNNIPNYIIITKIKKVLNYISKYSNDPTKYDNFLNNKSINVLLNELKTDLETKEKEENEKLSNMTFDSDHTYNIVQITTFEEACKYCKYTNPDSRWCLTYSLENYNNYTNDDTFAMYFCFRDDFETVQCKVGEECPMDDYGLSMLCVIVDTEGNLSTFTTRWNHNAKGHTVGADIGLADKYTISKIIGKPFNNVFKPYTEEEIEENAKRNYQMILNFGEEQWISDLKTLVGWAEDNLIDIYNSDHDEYDPDYDPSWDEIFDYINEYYENAPELKHSGIADYSAVTIIDDTFLILPVGNYYRILLLTHPNTYKKANDVLYTDFRTFYNAYNRIIFRVKTKNDNYYKLLAVNGLRLEEVPDLEFEYSTSSHQDSSLAPYHTINHGIFKLANGSFVKYKINTHGKPVIELDTKTYDAVPKNVKQLNIVEKDVTDLFIAKIDPDKDGNSYNLLSLDSDKLLLDTNITSICSIYGFKDKNKQLYRLYRKINNETSAKTTNILLRTGDKFELLLDQYTNWNIDYDTGTPNKLFFIKPIGNSNIFDLHDIIIFDIDTRQKTKTMQAYCKDYDIFNCIKRLKHDYWVTVTKNDGPYEFSIYDSTGTKIISDEFDKPTEYAKTAALDKGLCRNFKVIDQENQFIIYVNQNGCNYDYVYHVKHTYEELASRSAKNTNESIMLKFAAYLID